MKKIFIIGILIFVLTGCFNNKELEENIEKKELINNEIQELQNEESIKGIKNGEYNNEIQDLINNQMKKGPQVILDIDCNKKYSKEETINYCLEEQSKVKKIFKIGE